MTKEVLLSIQGLQVTDDNQSDTTEVIAPGEYYFRNGRHFLLYDEVSEEKQEVTKNIIKVSNDSMELTKRGIVNVHMVFEKDKKNVTYYYTPYGSLLVGINAYHIAVTEEAEKLVVDVKYALEINNEHLANCHIQIQATPRRDEGFKLV